MNTVIKINGLDVEMSEKVPTRIGPYWWCHHIGSVLVVKVIFNPCGDVLIDRQTDYQPSDVGGWWSTSPLVPAVEVERAWNEGMDCLGNLKPADRPSVAWAHSYAKRVTEGGE